MTDENKNQKEIEELRKFILNAEESLEAAKKALSELTGEDLSLYKSAKPSKVKTPSNVENGTIVEGIFNGENMVGPDGKIYPVPANYASKSKMVEGDRLKLTIGEDGSFIFKQIGPIERKNLVGTLVFEDNMYQVEAEGKKYNILYASATYHKAKPGDKVTIVVPANKDAQWAALENIIHATTDQTTPPTENENEQIDTSIFDIKKDDKQNELLQASDSLGHSASDINEKSDLSTPEPENNFVPPQPEKSLIEQESELEQINSNPEIVKEQTYQEPESAPPQSDTVQAESNVSELAADDRVGMPDESFLPRTQDDTTNSLGEASPGTLKNQEQGATELEI